jgi:dTDP-glucose pyrophosphorylase
MATTLAMESRFEVVILAGGECKRLYPLTSGGVVKALLPVGNRPLIWYPLRHLAESGIKKAVVVRPCRRGGGGGRWYPLGGGRGAGGPE